MFSYHYYREKTRTLFRNIKHSIGNIIIISVSLIEQSPPCQYAVCTFYLHTPYSREILYTYYLYNDSLIIIGGTHGSYDIIYIIYTLYIYIIYIKICTIILLSGREEECMCVRWCRTGRREDVCSYFTSLTYGVYVCVQLFWYGVYGNVYECNCVELNGTRRPSWTLCFRSQSEVRKHSACAGAGRVHR